MSDFCNCGDEVGEHQDWGCNLCDCRKTHRYFLAAQSARIQRLLGLLRACEDGGACCIASICPICGCAGTGWLESEMNHKPDCALKAELEAK